MPENKPKFYYQDPPIASNFHDLFLYFWDHGIGHFASETIQTPWTTGALEDAFLDVNRSIETRSIENWRSGKSVPTRKNMVILSIIAGRGVEFRRKRWSEAFLSHHRKKVKRVKIEKSEEVKISNWSHYKIGSKAVLALSLLGFFALSANYFIPVQKTSHSIEVSRVENSTSLNEFDHLVGGLSNVISNGLFQIESIKVVVSNGDKISKRKKDATYKLNSQVVEQSGRFILLSHLILNSTDEMVWSKGYSFTKLEELSNLQIELTNEIADVLNIVMTPAEKLRMEEIGTSDLNAYISYQRGRSLLKFWHEEKIPDNLTRAHQDLQAAIDYDVSWAEPRIHIVDIYHHFISGDIPGLLSRDGTQVFEDSLDAKSEIEKQLLAASRLATSPDNKDRALMNAIFFSDDWSDLKAPSKLYAEQAILGRGELEWLFEPVIMLVLGEYELIENLVAKRILKFDPDNGTGHAYAIRSKLLRRDYEGAFIRLKQAKSITFANRLDEVEGFLLVASGQGANLLEHTNNAKNLSEMHQDYFRALAFHLLGETERGLRIINNSQSLNDSKVYKAFALSHLERFDTASELFEEISSSPLGNLELGTAMAYGAACDLSPDNLPDSLKSLLSKANAHVPLCLRSL